MNISALSSSAPMSMPNRFKYNGKELNEEFDLNWYHYGARFYDPELGRWFNVDPLSGLMRQFSPYNYAFNNPLKFQDRDGRIPWPKIFGPRVTAKITSRFGPRVHPITKKQSVHKGVDLYAPEGTQVRTLAKGKVLKTGNDKYNGNYVFVEHDNGFVTKYIHLQDVNVSNGQSIGNGEQIGTVGQTGLAKGPHTHVELEKDGKEIDPTSIYDLDEKINRLNDLNTHKEGLESKIEALVNSEDSGSEVNQAYLKILEEWLAFANKLIEQENNLDNDEESTSSNEENENNNENND